MTADQAVQFEFATYIRPAHDLRKRLQVRLDVLSCTDCACSPNTHLPATCDASVPPPWVVVVPNPRLSTETHRVLTALCPDYARGAVPVLGWVSCPGGDPNLPPVMPTITAARACRHRLWQQLEALQYPPVMFVDQGWLAWRDDLAPMTVCGWSHVWGNAVDLQADGTVSGVWCMALGNVRGVGLGVESMPRLQGWMERFRWCVETEPDPFSMSDFSVADDEVGFARWLRPHCVVCGVKGNVHYDQDAVAYCDVHMDECGMKWRRQRAKWIENATTSR
jgi:hypothetical protein